MQEIKDLVAFAVTVSRFISHFWTCNIMTVPVRCFKHAKGNKNFFI